MVLLDKSFLVVVVEYWDVVGFSFGLLIYWDLEKLLGIVICGWVVLVEVIYWFVR